MSRTSRFALSGRGRRPFGVRHERSKWGAGQLFGQPGEDRDDGEPSGGGDDAAECQAGDDVAGVVGADVHAGEGHQYCECGGDDAPSPVGKQQADGNGAGGGGVVARDRESVVLSTRTCTLVIVS